MRSKIFGNQSCYKHVALVALAVALAAGSLPAQTVSFNDLASWNGTQVINAWGVPQSIVYGETFVAPAGDPVTMNDFTFYLKPETGGPSDYFQADIYQWTGPVASGEGGYPTGSPLFSYDTEYVGGSSFQAVTIDTGGVSLTPGGDYVALFTTADPTSISENSAHYISYSQIEFGVVAASSPGDGGGACVYYQSGSTLADAIGTEWTQGYPGNGYGSMAWTADFSTAPVPEPSSLALAGAGTLAFGWLARRRSRAK